MHKRNERSRLSSELQRQFSELGRSKSYRSASTSFGELTALLIGRAERESTGLRRAVEHLVAVAEVIPLNSVVLTEAAAIQIQFDMSIQDAIVLASVLGHLTETCPPESCFLNRNTKDFDDPNVRERLDRLNCRFFGRFDHALLYLEARLRGR